MVLCVLAVVVGLLDSRARCGPDMAQKFLLFLFRQGNMLFKQPGPGRFLKGHKQTGSLSTFSLDDLEVSANSCLGPADAFLAEALASQRHVAIGNSVECHFVGLGWMMSFWTELFGQTDTILSAKQLACIIHSCFPGCPSHLPWWFHGMSGGP